MNSWQQDVLAFHARFGAEIGSKPGVRKKKLRKRLIREEIKELREAIDQNDIPGIADGIVDAMYVLIGTAITCGIDLEPIWNAVQEANMAKVGGGMREDGKVLKPEGWQPPDVEGLLRQQGWNG